MEEAVAALVQLNPSETVTVTVLQTFLTNPTADSSNHM